MPTPDKEKEKPAPAPVSEEKAADYSDAKFLDKQIELAKQALQQTEMEFTARSNMLRGTLNTLQAIKEKKPMITMQEPPPALPLK
jgi:hypothetical protein